MGMVILSPPASVVHRCIASMKGSTVMPWIIVQCLCRWMPRLCSNFGEYDATCEIYVSIWKFEYFETCELRNRIQLSI